MDNIVVVPIRSGVGLRLGAKSAAAQRFIAEAAPDIARIQRIIGEIKDAGFRASEVLDAACKLMSLLSRADCSAIFELARRAYNCVIS